jgi:hypothetical protein
MAGKKSRDAATNRDIASRDRNSKLMNSSRST